MVLRAGIRLITVLVAAVVVPAAGAPTVKIVVPPAFKVSTFAAGLQHPTAMAWGPDNRLYVTEDTGLVVVAARGSQKPQVVVRRLRTPLGLAWQDQTLFVSEQGRLTRFTLQGTALAGRQAVVRGLPFGLHQQDTVVLGADGRLYLGSGSTCDACRERNRRSATVLSLRPDGSDLRIVARGLRNPFGLAFQPGTGRLYASVNGQDELGTKTAAGAGRDGCRREERCLLRVAALLAELLETAARRALPGGDASGRLPRAALLRRRARVLAWRSVRRSVGRVPERPARPHAHADPARPGWAGDPRHEVRERVRPSARARGRPRRRVSSSPTGAEA